MVNCDNLLTFQREAAGSCEVQIVFCMPHVAMRICHQVRIGLKKEKKKKKGRKKQMCKLDTVLKKQTTDTISRKHVPGCAEVDALPSGATFFNV